MTENQFWYLVGGGFLVLMITFLILGLVFDW